MTALRRLDRRWLYLGVLLITVAAAVWPLRIAPRPTRETRTAFDLAQALQPGAGVFVYVEYGLGSREEMDPMLAAVLGHLADRRAHIVIAARSPEASQVAETVMGGVAARDPAYAKGYGQTWVNLGYRPAPDVALRAATSGIAAAYNEVDYAGRPLAGMPILQALRALNRTYFALAYAFDSGDGFAPMIYYVGTPTGLPVIIGAISMEVPLLQPYLAAGQLAAVIAGARGAAEYEALAGQPRRADVLVGASAMAAIYVLTVMLLGNLVARRP
jgi:hypothetical protein